MIGNVDEWTRSRFESYPYRPDDGREKLTAGIDVLIVVRGGQAGALSERVFRAAHRGGFLPFEAIGFRVVVSPFQR
jgi:formylglycine-generating enzyme required for sulfatase activity